MRRVVAFSDVGWRKRSARLLRIEGIESEHVWLTS
jgi:hypothetical protein